MSDELHYDNYWAEKEGKGTWIWMAQTQKSPGQMEIRQMSSFDKQNSVLARSSELPENWTDTKETLVDGMTFNLRHMGMTLVDQPKGEDVSAAAIKRIIATAKAGGRKLRKEMLIYDYVSNQLIERIPINRISYCAADKTHNRVFAYIAQNQHNETLECAKKKVLQFGELRILCRLAASHTNPQILDTGLNAPHSTLPLRAD